VVPGPPEQGMADASSASYFTSRFRSPPIPRNFVVRNRLSTRLDSGARHGLTLVSAPAGTGKTTLAAGWLAKQKLAEEDMLAITFEEGDDRPGLFWQCLGEGLRLRGIDPAPAQAPINSDAVSRTFLGRLATLLAARTEPLTLVLDGYELTSPRVGADFDYLLSHSGGILRCVLITRVDPLLPLHRYRLAETLTEVRMQDLAFTSAEVLTLLRQERIVLAAESVERLTERTRGWAAGLRFAMMIMAQQREPEQAVHDLAGDTGNIAEYLLAEVLGAQPPEVRDLLMQTSVVDVLSPGLIEALAGRHARRTLAHLSRGNAFVESLSDHPGHFRYHALFRELLRSELSFRSPETFSTMHRKAAQWFAGHGQVSTAIQHLTTVDAWADAAGQLVDNLGIGELLLRKSDGLSTTFGRMPSKVSTPAASIVRAALATPVLDPGLIEGELSRAREGLQQTAGHQTHGLRVAIDVVSILQARLMPDVDRAIAVADAAQQDLDGVLPDRLAEHPELTALVLTYKGAFLLWSGDLDHASKMLLTGLDAACKPGCESPRSDCLGQLALISVVRGRLRLARHRAEQSLSVAEEGGVSPYARNPAADVALALVCGERYDLSAAQEHAHRANAVDPSLTDPVSRALLGLVEARLHRSHGDLRAAQARIVAAQRDPQLSTWLREMLVVEEAALLIVAGEADQAERRLEGVANTPVACLIQTQARLALGEESSPETVLALLRGPAMPLEARVGALLLQASHALDSEPTAGGRAEGALKQALRLAAAEGLQRQFREAPGNVQRLVDDVAQAGDTSSSSVRGRSGGSAPLMVEHLSPKELEVLGNLAELLTTEEIAQTMFVSVNTVRTHVRSILRKLSVSRRNDAVRRARELGLIAS
jgi:LuxR family transcriptional regulator, maltose regulon positive regulatory protein